MQYPENSSPACLINMKKSEETCPTSVQIALQKLITDTLHFLNQEFTPDSFFVCEPETYDDFKTVHHPQVQKEEPLSQVEEIRPLPKKESKQNFQVFKPVINKTISSKTPIENTPQDASRPLFSEGKELVARAPDGSLRRDNTHSEKPEKTSFKLEPQATTPIDTMKEICQVVKKTLPELIISMEIPDDAHARRINTIWKEQSLSAEVVVLFFQDSSLEVQFLKNIAKAIDVLIQPTRLVDAVHLENEKKWPLFLNSDRLKLVLASSKSILKYPELKKYYKEMPHSSEFFLGKIPLLSLAPIASYFKTPTLKRALWQKICQMLKS